MQENNRDGEKRDLPLKVEHHRNITDNQISQRVNCIFENSSVSDPTSHSLVNQSNQITKFDDTLDHFVNILKKTTSCHCINIYTKEMIQIFADPEDYNGMLVKLNQNNILEELTKELTNQPQALSESS